MPVIHLDHLEAEVSRKQLLEAVKALPAAERNVFLAEVLSLKSGEGSAHLSASESDLLERINSGPSQEEWTRFHELNERRRQETISAAEQAELLELVDMVEEFQADRVEALAKLARLRGVTLSELMQALGIKAPGYV